MNNIFVFYTQSILINCVFIAFAFVFRLLLHKESNILKNIIWLFLLIRLLCPIALETSMKTFPTMQHILEQKNITIEKQTIMQQDKEYEENIIAKSDFQKENKNTISLNTVLMCIWYIGVVILLFYSAIRYCVFYKKSKKAVKLEEYENVYEWLDKTGACVIGLWKPKVYVPKELKTEELDVVLRHEKMHIKRYDNIFIALYYIALCLNWYNPLCWIVFYTVQQDIELACDEQVLQGADISERKKYATTLLTIYKRTVWNEISLSFGKGNLKKRVKNIGKAYVTKKMLYIEVIIVCLCVLLGSCFVHTKVHDYTEIVEHKANEIFDAQMPKIGYVDNDILVFYDNVGIYVYHFQDKEIKGYVDLKEIEMDGIEGENATFVVATSTGEFVYLWKEGGEIYEYNIKKDKCKKIESQDNEEIWKPQIKNSVSMETSQYYNVSEIYETKEKEIYFLALDKKHELDYGALLFIKKIKNKEQVYTLFEK